MMEFLKKNKGVILVGTYVASVIGIAGTYIATVIRGDKRSIQWYKDQKEVMQAEIDYFRGEAKKGS